MSSAYVSCPIVTLCVCCCCCCCCKYQFGTLYRICRFITVVFSEMKLSFFLRKKKKRKERLLFTPYSKGSARVGIITVYSIIIKNWRTVYTLVLIKSIVFFPPLKLAIGILIEVYLFVPKHQWKWKRHEKERQSKTDWLPKIISIDSWHGTMCVCMCSCVQSLHQAFQCHSHNFKRDHLLLQKLNNQFYRFMFVGTVEFKSYLHLFTTKWTRNYNFDDEIVLMIRQMDQLYPLLLSPCKRHILQAII